MEAADSLSLEEFKSSGAVDLGTRSSGGHGSFRVVFELLEVFSNLNDSEDMELLGKVQTKATRLVR